MDKKAAAKTDTGHSFTGHGDIVITLPYLQSLRHALPKDVKIDLLTRKEVDPIPRSVELFDKIYSLGGGRNFKKQFILCLLMLPKLL